jgi:integrase
MPLTDVKIRQAKAADKPIKLPNGSKLWRYRYRIAGKENTFAVGEYPAMSLQDARKARDEARELVKQGIHPSHARQASVTEQIASNANTFQCVAVEWLGKKKASWSAGYYDQAKRCLELNAFPKVGRLPIRSVTAAQLLNVLQTMENRGAESYALQLRQWLSNIFCYAVATQRADADPASALKRAILRPPTSHSKPMTAEHIADLKAKLEKYGGNRTTVLAIKLMLYTFVRTVELRKAAWAEFDFEANRWTIQADRMKMRRIHLVPLSRQALAILAELKTITGSGAFLFPNFRKPNGVMHSSTINRALELMGYEPGEWTGHDFRATASTQLNEMGYRENVVELQLAHAEQNKTKAAYNHAQYLPERTRMMQEWADWIDGIPAKSGDPTPLAETVEPAA